jgi:DUF1365 family protein
MSHPLLTYYCHCRRFDLWTKIIEFENNNTYGYGQTTHY